jgi:hypothetical protein
MQVLSVTSESLAFPGTAGCDQLNRRHPRLGPLEHSSVSSRRSLARALLDLNPPNSSLCEEIDDAITCFGPPLHEDTGKVEVATQESQKVEKLQTLIMSVPDTLTSADVSDVDGFASNFLKRRMKPNDEAEKSPERKRTRMSQRKDSGGSFVCKQGCQLLQCWNFAGFFSCEHGRQQLKCWACIKIFEKGPPEMEQKGHIFAIAANKNCDSKTTEEGPSADTAR